MPPACAAPPAWPPMTPPGATIDRPCATASPNGPRPAPPGPATGRGVGPFPPTGPGVRPGPNGPSGPITGGGYPPGGGVMGGGGGGGGGGGVITVPGGAAPPLSTGPVVASEPIVAPGGGGSDTGGGGMCGGVAQLLPGPLAPLRRPPDPLPLPDCSLPKGVISSLRVGFGSNGTGTAILLVFSKTVLSDSAMCLAACSVSCLRQSSGTSGERSISPRIVG